MDRKTVTLSQLSANLCANLPEMRAILITDRKCQILFNYDRSDHISDSSDNSENSSNSEQSELSDHSLPQTPPDPFKTEVLTSINLQLNPILDQIHQEDTGAKFTSAIFEAENFRVFNLFVDRWIFIYDLSFESFIDRLNPYIFLTSEKFYRILTQEGRAQVELEIPKLGNILGLKFLPNDKNQVKKYAFKFTLIGDSGVGKTSLVNRFVEGIFPHDFRPTIGVNILTHTYMFMENQVKLIIFDIGSQKFFQRVRRMYYLGTNAAIIVFDLNRRESFLAVTAWKTELDEHIEEDYTVVLVGNKSDLKREVSIEEAQEQAQLWDAPYIETSALVGENVEEMFFMTTYNIIKKKQKMLQAQE
ncbi:MAG: GTP-binding protein [Promethearchaeota archaeon]|nr:MAG: GTP-binding protein [Candidatus Lokiarchaeota archaeon]